MDTLTPEQQQAEEAYQSISRTKRYWVLPILRALENAGGAEKPKVVKDKACELFGDALTDAQKEYAKTKGRIGWTRFDMAERGLLGGEKGRWELEPLGRTLLKMYEGLPLEAPDNLPESSASKAEPDIDTPTRTVDVSHFDAYDHAVLQTLAKGRKAKQTILSEVMKSLDNQLLPGDRETMRSGEQVCRYRCSWSISNLKQQGYIANPVRGQWELTESGKERLAGLPEQLDISSYQGYSQAAVVDLTHSREPKETSPDFKARLKQALGSEAVKELWERLQIDRGPTPTNPRGLTRNLVFYGPPGTGKTHVAKLIAQTLTGEEDPQADNHWRIVQFHPSYAYEDFIQGLRPNLEQPTLTYKVVAGPFREICQNAEEEPDNFFVLIIDEINRGDPARIFGELLYALEYRGEAVEMPLGSALVVPPNLIVLGTMNSVDRSVALVDYALRRRFGFFRVDPDPTILSAAVEGSGLLAESVLDTFNAWLRQELGKDHSIGHSFFLNPSYHPFTRESLDKVWRFDIFPLLEEYFYGDSERLAHARERWQAAVKNAWKQMEAAEEEDEDETS